MRLNCTSSTEDSQLGNSGEVPRRTGSASESVNFPPTFAGNDLQTYDLNEKNKTKNRRSTCGPLWCWERVSASRFFLLFFYNQEKHSEPNESKSLCEQAASEHNHTHTYTHINIPVLSLPLTNLKTFRLLQKGRPALSPQEEREPEKWRWKFSTELLIHELSPDAVPLSSCRFPSNARSCFHQRPSSNPIFFHLVPTFLPSIRNLQFPRSSSSSRGAPLQLHAVKL